MKKIIFCIFALLVVGINVSVQAQKSRLQQTDVNKLIEATARINALYVDTVNGTELVENGIRGMLSKLDPHSVFIPEKEVKEMSEPLEGNFEGIGVQFQMIDDTLYVDNVISNGPSEKVGILPGDRIVMVNDTSIAGVKMSNIGIMKKLRGKKGTVVYVKVVRRGVPEMIVFKITRDKIPLHSIVAFYMITPAVGYIKLDKFSATTKDEFDEAMKKLKKQGMKDLILDLQSNGGGYLKAATDIGSDFLGDKKLIVYTEGRNDRINYTAASNGDFEKGRLILLMNEYSASASEILAGAVQDWDRGLIVGRRSFGKGLVQQQLPLSDGSMIRLTTARYYTPSGRCIQRPYADGVEKYRSDLEERYHHGELTSEDSVHFADSLRYETLTMHRTVYGGGGIMPDCFVPLDTAFNSKYLRSIGAKGIVGTFASKYIERYGEKWKKEYPSLEKFNAQFVVTDDILKELTQLAETDKIPFDEAGFNKSKSYLSIQLKGLFARRLFDDNAFYQVVNSENDACQKALEILRTPGLYEKSFEKKK